MNTRITSLAVAAALAFCGSLHAGPINGSINFDGIATTNTGDLFTATAFDTITDVTVVPADTGSYAGTAGAPASFIPFAFSDTSVSPLWQVAWGPDVYWFDALGAITVAQYSSGGAQFLNLSGSGVAYEDGPAGLQSAPGFWSITDTMVGKETTFTFGAATTVPDVGNTAIMLAFGFATLGLLALVKKPRIVVK